MNEDTLILYYYGDGLSDDERADVEAAFASDASLRERYRELRRSLDRFDEPPAAQAPAHMVARWHRSIDRAAAGERVEKEAGGGGWHFPSFAWGALAAALLAAAGIAIYSPGDRAPTAPSIAGRTDDRTDEAGIDDRSSMPAAAPAAFSRGLKVHLRQSREDIMRVTENENADRTLLIMDIMRQNRLFERAAREHDAEDVARVLRAFEPVLLRLADEDTDARDAAALRAKLAFELSVMLTKIETGESDDTDSI